MTSELSKEVKEMKDLQRFVDQFGTGIGVKKLAEKAYRAMELAGHDVCILNDKYMIVDGAKYRFVKSNGDWIVKEW